MSIPGFWFIIWVAVITLAVIWASKKFGVGPAAS